MRRNRIRLYLVIRAFGPYGMGDGQSREPGQPAEYFCLEKIESDFLGWSSRFPFPMENTRQWNWFSSTNPSANLTAFGTWYFANRLTNGGRGSPLLYCACPRTWPAGVGRTDHGRQFGKRSAAVHCEQRFSSSRSIPCAVCARNGERKNAFISRRLSAPRFITRLLE